MNDTSAKQAVRGLVGFAQTSEAQDPNAANRRSVLEAWELGGTLTLSGRNVLAPTKCILASERPCKSCASCR